MSYDEFRNFCENSLKEGTRIFDEGKFIENIRALEQKNEQNTSHKGTPEDKKRSPLEDYKEAIEDSTDLSYRKGSIDKSIGEIRADLIIEEKEQNNDEANKKKNNNDDLDDYAGH